MNEGREQTCRNQDGEYSSECKGPEVHLLGASEELERANVSGKVGRGDWWELRPEHVGSCRPW